MSLSLIELVDGLTELEKDTERRKRLYSSSIPNGECIMIDDERGFVITDGTYLGRSTGEALRNIVKQPWSKYAIWELAVLKKEL